MRILHSDSEALDDRDSRHHGLQDRCVYVAFWVPSEIATR